MIRRGLKALLAAAARSPRVWPWLDRGPLQALRYAEACHRDHARGAAAARRAARIEAAIAHHCPDLVVRDGPFRGLVYPAAEARGSVLFPKLMGCYERELHPVLERLLAAGFDAVADIGCAEGYYAVGLARRLAQVPVFAYDTDAAALAACARMAQANGVAGRVHLAARCTRDALAAALAGRRALIVCDCEGCEADLLVGADPALLRTHDLVVEVHELARPGVSLRLCQQFQHSHRIEVVASVDARERAAHDGPPPLRALDPAARAELLDERRPAPMHWLVLHAIAAREPASA